jgi:hypothetical protein
MTTFAKPIHLSSEELREKLDYRDGALFWKVKPCKHMGAGALAGSLGKNGYRTVRVDGVVYLEHRVIFKMYTGQEPSHVDHIDRNPQNNRIENLRASSFAENAWNCGVPKTNKSGEVGVHFSRSKQKWVAYMRVHGLRHHLGYFTDFKDAVAARKAGEIMRQVDAGDLVIQEADA